jgi:hypothetical protein
VWQRVVSPQSPAPFYPCPQGCPAARSDDGSGQLHRCTDVIGFMSRWSSSTAPESDVALSQSRRGTPKPETPRRRRPATSPRRDTAGLTGLTPSRGVSIGLDQLFGLAEPSKDHRKIVSRVEQPLASDMERRRYCGCRCAASAQQARAGATGAAPRIRGMDDSRSRRLTLGRLSLTHGRSRRDHVVALGSSPSSKAVARRLRLGCSQCRAEASVLLSAQREVAVAVREDAGAGT